MVKNVVSFLQSHNSPWQKQGIQWNCNCKHFRAPDREASPPLERKREFEIVKTRRGKRRPFCFTRSFLLHAFIPLSSSITHLENREVTPSISVSLALYWRHLHSLGWLIAHESSFDGDGGTGDGYVTIFHQKAHLSARLYSRQLFSVLTIVVEQKYSGQKLHFDCYTFV